MSEQERIETPKYIKGKTAQSILEVDYLALRRIAKAGLIGVMHVPGTTPKYCAQDVLRLAQQSYKPAVTTTNYVSR